MKNARTRHLFAIAATLLTLAASPLSVAHAQTNAEQPLDEDSIFVVTHGGESVLDALHRDSISRPDQQPQAEFFLETWEQRLQAGENIYLGEQLADLTIDEKLDHVSATQDLLTRTEEAAPVAGDSMPGETIQPFASGINPNYFSVRGWPGNGQTGHYHWTQLTLIIAGRYCGQTGCQPDTDRITCNLTVNPGAVTSRIDWTCGYFPNSDNFTGIHFEKWAINRGNIVAIEDSETLFTSTGGSGVEYISSSSSLRGTVLTIAFALWVKSEPENLWRFDGGKTADATCSTSDNTCAYLYR